MSRLVMMKDKTPANILTGEFWTRIKGGRGRAAGRRRKAKKPRKGGKTMHKMVVLQDKTQTNFLSPEGKRLTSGTPFYPGNLFV